MGVLIVKLEYQKTGRQTKMKFGVERKTENGKVTKYWILYIVNHRDFGLISAASRNFG